MVWVFDMVFSLLVSSDDASLPNNGFPALFPNPVQGPANFQAVYGSKSVHTGYSVGVEQ
jgi:hypothetical protein